MSTRPGRSYRPTAPALNNERCYRTTAGGTSGGAEPTWNTGKGTTTTDSGGVAWVEVTGNQTYQAPGAWAAPHARLQNACQNSWMASGDTVFVAANHAETQSATISIMVSSVRRRPEFHPVRRQQWQRACAAAVGRSAHHGDRHDHGQLLNRLVGHFQLLLRDHIQFGERFIEWLRRHPRHFGQRRRLAEIRKLRVPADGQCQFAGNHGWQQWRLCRVGKHHRLFQRGRIVGHHGIRGQLHLVAHRQRHHRRAQSQRHFRLRAERAHPARRRRPVRHQSHPSRRLGQPRMRGRVRQLQAGVRAVDL